MKSISGISSSLLPDFAILYTASNCALDNVPNLEYSTIDELIQKTKKIQADIVLTCDKELIRNGIADEFKKNRLNIICVNKKWSNIEKSKLIAKQLLSHYSINCPQTLLCPTAFPVVLKLDDSDNTQKFFANSMHELIDKRLEWENIFQNKKMFIEEYLKGDEYSLLILWDMKNALSFPVDNDEHNINLTEVQIDRLELLKTKLNFMLSDEQADFTGFLVLKLLWAKTFCIKTFVRKNNHS